MKIVALVSAIFLPATFMAVRQNDDKSYEALADLAADIIWFKLLCLLPRSKQVDCSFQLLGLYCLYCWLFVYGYNSLESPSKSPPVSNLQGLFQQHLLFFLAALLADSRKVVTKKSCEQ
jgi:hypothetical protein